jgi:8-oxo-dGTP pyrophosphatase MutT (NUDIX family)
MKRQVAAIPILVDDTGERRVMLMTSRETRRWVIPKGWPIKGLKPHKAAEREAFEEAGLLGNISKKAIGSYEYLKRLGNASEPCDVKVYLMSVKAQATNWPEKGEREIEPVSLHEAANRVDEAGLKAIFERLELEAQSLKRVAGKTEALRKG